MRVIIVALTTASAVAYLAPSRANHKRSCTGLIAISSGLSDEPPVKEEKELSGEDMDKIERDIRDNAPSELEVRLNLLGVTPWTVAGFILAGVIITLNNDTRRAVTFSIYDSFVNGVATDYNTFELGPRSELEVRASDVGANLFFNRGWFGVGDFTNN